MALANLSDVRCYYDVVGHGAPLLLIPGLGVTCDIWEPVIGQFAERFSVVNLDNRGVGRSVALRRPKTLRDYAADLVELMDHLQLERAHVLGVSLGGVIAQQLASDHPNRIDRLVLVSCTDRFTPYLQQISLLLGHTLSRGRNAAFARTVELLGCSPEYLDARPELLEARVEAKCDMGVSGRSVGEQLRCLAATTINLEANPISAPTLVMAGERDVLIPSCYARSMSNRIAGSRFILVEGVGHNPLTEAPQRTLGPIIEFLNDDTPAAGHAPRMFATLSSGLDLSPVGGTCP